MTRTILGPGGEQQRVTIERDFKNEAELNNFLRQFGDGLNKKGNGGHESNGRKSTVSSSHRNSHKQKRNSSSDLNDFKKPPGLVYSLNFQIQELLAKFYIRNIFNN